MPRGRNTITACERSVVIRSATWREAAIEVAKQRFVELEGIPSWQIHASIIEAGLLDSIGAALVSRMLRPVDPIKGMDRQLRELRQINAATHRGPKVAAWQPCTVKRLDGRGSIGELVYVDGG